MAKLKTRQKSEYQKKKGVFTQSCPNCRAKDKLVVHCKKCLIPCCSECSAEINNKIMCIDCFTDLKTDYEIAQYEEEKYLKKQAIPQ